MKKSISIKTLAIVMALVLAIGVIAGASFAYLKKSTTSVKNTFVKGDGITLNLFEHKWNGSALTSEIVQANEYKVTPGNTYAKDPTITANTSNIECYLFVKVVETGSLSGKISYSIDSNWTELTSGSGVYYRTIKTSANTNYSVLASNQFTVANTVSEEQLNALGTGAGLTFTAYCIQKADLTPAAAWAQF